jgi:hypothetical protein
MEKQKDTRARNFATVVYPESAPHGWASILEEEFIPAFISPLHDSDINPTGEPKKPHYHVMVMFEGKKSTDQVKAIFEKFGGVGVERVNSIRGYARYLCHLDNPEKFQYKTENVVSLCGADYMHTIGLALDKYKAIGEIIDYCKENDIVSYAVLLEYCRANKFDWFRVLCDNGSYVIDKYLKSRQWTIQQTENESEKHFPSQQR